MAPTTATPTVGTSTLLPTTATTTATPTVATTTATPTVQPTIPVAMDNTNNPTKMVPTIAPSIETSGFPSSLFPSNFFSSSLFITTKATGDRAIGDCYFVDVQQICNFIKPPPCHEYIMMFTYYNGGFYRDPNNPESEDWMDSGESETIYEVVTVTGIVDCENEETTPDTCTIAVQNRGTCNECRYDRETKLYSLVDCSNLPGVIFEQGVEQSYQYYDDGALPPYEHQFFTLEFDQERCDEYALPEG
ncbi:expressed unknown protein [Seminavis robusta]|uniref:Uncharacterized protein n=1 Tax=Seminavis robusta TaxID=568900 RepID=A0A9N8EN50_9STRA|nr:expressed unknown protein [Seminavis robusta]|eukprot:Sro1207_g252470.1 n/a (247) ;mRNA; f:14117-14857